jgi:hypothetical protein
MFLDCFALVGAVAIEPLAQPRDVARADEIFRRHDG